QYFSGPRSAATGGAGRASVLGPEAHFLNPAAIALLEEYHLAYLYRYDDWPEDVGQRDWSLLAVDAHPEAIVPAGISYLNVEKNFFGTRVEEEDFQLSIGKRIYERIAVGFYIRHWTQRAAGIED